MTRAASGTWALPTNSFRPAVAATSIDPSAWNNTYADIELGFNENIYGVLSSDYTLTDQNTVQKAFNNSTNGTIAVAASTTYLMDWLYMISNTGTNAHTWAVVFALTTATLTSSAMRVQARTGITSAATITAVSDLFSADITSNLVVTASSTSSTEFVTIRGDAVFRVSTGGTMTPQVKLSATTGGTLKMLANSFIRLRPIGGNTVTSIGTWT